MDRRRVLLIVAAVIAALGTLLVFFYVRSADNRAAQEYDAVKVLRAVKQINPGETVEAAQQAGKIEEGTVAAGQQLPGALTDLAPISGQIATTTIYPGEQIISTKFSTSAATTSALTIPKDKIAISITLTDTARVAGFVNPGNDVAIFLNGSGPSGAYSRLLLPKVQVIAIGTTTMTTTTTTDETGAQTTEQLPRTLFTVAVDQRQAQQIMLAQSSGELALALMGEEAKVKPDPGITTNNLFG
jgi:pilus assembly protein CpaB